MIVEAMIAGLRFSFIREKQKPAVVEFNCFSIQSYIFKDASGSSPVAVQESETCFI